MESSFIPQVRAQHDRAVARLPPMVTVVSPFVPFGELQDNTELLQALEPREPFEVAMGAYRDFSMSRGHVLRLVPGF